MDQLNEDQMAEFKEAFSLFDKEDKGAIGAEELGGAMRSLGHNLTEEEVHDLINEADSDGNGLIDIEEFVSFLARRLKSSEPEEDLQEIFKKFDKDGNGLLNDTDIKAAMAEMNEKMTDEDIKEMIETTDKDGDGQINFEEFKEIMNGK